MFCHKCGAKITEGSEFCHKCGTKVVSSETKSNTAITEESAKAEINSGNTNSASDDLIFVTIISVGNKKMDIIKALKDFFDITLAEAKEAAEEIPMLIKKPMSYTDAKRLKEILSELGAEVSFSDTNGKPVNIQKSRTENDPILNDGKDLCSDRETPIHNNTTATEKDDLKSKIPHSIAGLKNYFNSLSSSKKLLFLLAVFDEDDIIREAYSQKIRELAAENSDMTFSLIDLTADDVYELVADKSGYYVNIYAYDNGSVVPIVEERG